MASRRILLGLADDPQQLDEELLRRVMVANALFACDGDGGRYEGDPVFDEITEGRQKNDGYSGCADLIHWLLRRAGLRDERILNRTDDDGEIEWRSAVNIARLVGGAGKAFKYTKRGEGTAVGGPWQVKHGNMGFIGEGEAEHVFLVTRVDPQAVWTPTNRQIESVDFGQFEKGKHAGARRWRTPVTWNGRLYLFSKTLPGRPWRGQLDMVELLRPYYLKNQLAPAEVPDDFEGGIASDNPYA